MDSLGERERRRGFGRDTTSTTVESREDSSSHGDVFFFTFGLEKTRINKE